MCGRYVVDDATIAQVGLELGAEWAAPRPEPSYNVAPSQYAPVVTEHGGARRVEMVRWGFQRTNRETGGRIQVINARAERVAWNFGTAFREGRCLVPASGFYEWVREGKRKQPQYIHPARGDLLTLAGLCEAWRPDPDAEPIPTYLILTTAANSFMSPIHQRMPVILDGPDRDLWLSSGASTRDLTALLRAAPEARLTAYPVSDHVNSPGNQGEACIAPLG